VLNDLVRLAQALRSASARRACPIQRMRRSRTSTASSALPTAAPAWPGTPDVRSSPPLTPLRGHVHRPPSDLTPSVANTP